MFHVPILDVTGLTGRYDVTRSPGTAMPGHRGHPRGARGVCSARVGRKEQLRALLGKSARGTQSILERMQVRAAPQRPIDPEHFQAICDATLRRKKLRIR